MIYLNEHGKAKYINLCHQFLLKKRERFLSEDIGEFSELEGLILNGNLFNGVLPDRLGELTKLTELNLSENLFSGTLPPCMSKLTALTDLNLGNNPDLKGNIHVQVMRHCPNLKRCIYDIYLWHHIQKDALRALLMSMKMGRRKRKKRRESTIEHMPDMLEQPQNESNDDDMSKVNSISEEDDQDCGKGYESLGSTSPISSPEKPTETDTISGLWHLHSKKRHHHNKQEEECEEDVAERERLKAEKRQEELLEKKRLEAEEEAERLRMLDVTIDTNMKTWIHQELDEIAKKPQVKLLSEDDVEYNPVYEVVYDAEDGSYRYNL